MDNGFTWSPFFKVTNLCNYNCAHCCERSGPNAAESFIPMSDVRNIIEQFKYVKNKIPVAVISGGEPMMMYNHAKYYIPQIMKTLARAGFAIELKTNAAWTLRPDAQIIFNDLEQFFVKFPTAYFTYHLSLDKFHPRAQQTSMEFIRWYYNNDKLSRRATIHLFYDDAQSVTDMFMALADNYNILLDLKNTPQNEFSKIGAKLFFRKEKYIVIEPYHGINNRGRAKDNGIATKNATSVMKNFSNIGQTHGLAFDNMGMSYFDCNGDDVKTPYKNPRGKIKPVEQIKKELFNMLYEKYLTENGK